MKTWGTLGLVLVAAALSSFSVTSAVGPGRVALLVHNITTGVDYATIQEAIVAANPGDEIVVDPDTYFERINLLGKAITLRSTAPTDPAVVAATIIDGGTVGSVVTCATGETPATVIDGFTITKGRAARGGGMYNESSSPTVTNCTFRLNEALATDGGGGGMYNYSSARPTVSNCTFIGNWASGTGGGMKNHTSEPTVTNCVFSGNGAAGFGGGMSNQSSSPPVTNCIFTGNWVNEFSGGGMSNSFASPTVTNCTFSDNSSNPFDARGGGMANGTNCNPTLTNCVFWGNTGPEIYDRPGSTTVATYSCIQGGWPGAGNINANPMFVDADGADNWEGTLDDDLHLRDDSPCINTGDDAAVPADVTTDYEGDARIQQCRVDMGADESPYFVDCNNNGRADECDIADGTSHDVDDDDIPDDCEPVHNVTQDTLHLTIQEAIVASVAADEIEVSPGTYFERINLLGKAITLRSTDGAEATIIDGGDGGSVVTCAGGETNATVIDGFTITNGSAPQGGGMYLYSTKPTVTHCIFTGNSAAWDGGGIYCESLQGLEECAPIVTDCTFNANAAVNFGGGLSSSLGSSPVVINCTFSGNSAAYGGGIYTSPGSKTRAISTILWGNTADSDGSQIFDHPPDGLTYADNTCIEGGWPGGDNIATDPMFVDADGPDDVLGTLDDNLRLQPGSQAINAGDSGSYFQPDATDLDGHARVLCGRVDMGAYEFGLGDFDCNQRIDVVDCTGWEDCLTGPGHFHQYRESCAALDLDFDGDVDLDDVNLFQQLFGGT